MKDKKSQLSIEENLNILSKTIQKANKNMRKLIDECKFITINVQTSILTRKYNTDTKIWYWNIYINPDVSKKFFLSKYDDVRILILSKISLDSLI